MSLVGLKVAYQTSLKRPLAPDIVSHSRSTILLQTSCYSPPTLPPFQLLCATMAVPADEDFNQITASFLTWFKRLQGANVNSKLHIADMRNRKAGRGIGKLLCPLYI